MNHPDTDIADAIIAGIGGADNSTEQMAAVVTNLERAGFKIIPRLQHEALMAAVKAGYAVIKGVDRNHEREPPLRYEAPWKEVTDLIEALAALRAAGIQIEGEGK